MNWNKKKIFFKKNYPFIEQSFYNGYKRIQCWHIWEPSSFLGDDTEMILKPHAFSLFKMTFKMQKSLSNNGVIVWAWVFYGCIYSIKQSEGNEKELY